MKLEKKDLVRFWAKIQATEDDKCWVWTGAKSSAGYGRFKVNGKLLSPHRIAYSLFNEAELTDLFVCHTCDNPSCCNPKHLFLGTRSENMKDCFKKGRLTSYRAGYIAAMKTGKFFYRGGNKQSGESSPSAKLKNEDVLKIRELSAQGQDNIVISEIFGVTPRNISKIVHRETWKHI